MSGNFSKLLLFYMLSILCYVAKLPLTLNWQYIQMLRGSARGFVALPYIILKLLRVNLFLWGRELANSFLLFRELDEKQ